MSKKNLTPDPSDSQIPKLTKGQNSLLRRIFDGEYIYWNNYRLILRGTDGKAIRIDWKPLEKAGLVQRDDTSRTVINRLIITPAGRLALGGANEPTPVVETKQALIDRAAILDDDNVLPYSLRRMLDLETPEPDQPTPEPNVALMTATERENAYGRLDTIANKLGYAATVPIRVYISQLEARIAALESASKGGAK